MPLLIELAYSQQEVCYKWKYLGYTQKSYDKAIFQPCNS
jgi:hypothetical protein